MSGLRAIPLGLPLARFLHHTSVTSLKDDDIDHAPLSQPRLVLSAKTQRHSKSSPKKMAVHMQKEFTVYHRTSQDYYPSKGTLISPEDRKYKKRTCQMQFIATSHHLIPKLRTGTGQDDDPLVASRIHDYSSLLHVTRVSLDEGCARGLTRVFRGLFSWEGKAQRRRISVEARE